MFKALMSSLRKPFRPGPGTCGETATALAVGVARVVIVSGAGCLLVAAGGCAPAKTSVLPSTPGETADTALSERDPIDAVPQDFGLDVLIRHGVDRPAEGAVEGRPSRFILFPDGSLHYGAAPDGARHTELIDWRPPRVRVLSRTQVAGVWRDVVAMGFGLARSAENAPRALTDVSPDRRSQVTSVMISGNDAATLYVDVADAERSPAPAYVRLTRSLAALAWASDRRDTDAPIIPRRYDLGGNPYARFSAAGDQTGSGSSR